MKHFITFLMVALLASAGMAQQTMELTFTAQNNGQSVALDSIYIENLTQGGDTTLYAPNTTLVLDYVTGIGDSKMTEENTFAVSQNYPNPFKEKTEVNLYLPEKDGITITIRDVLGREIAKYSNTLNRGSHTFTFYPGNDKYYLLTASGNQTSSTIKMLHVNNNSSDSEKCKIEYTWHNANNFKFQNAINDFVFAPGDELRYIGYAKTINTVNGSDVIEDAPEVNTSYEFEITEGIPCPETPTVFYEGQTYNTVLIGTQCWFKENLNYETGNSWCYNNDPSYCDTYGRLYDWETALSVCPSGWHLPSDDEWKILEGAVDSQYPVGDPEWDNDGLRGLDVGENLKSTSGWIINGNGTDLYGFSGLPGGIRSTFGDFYFLENNGQWWVSTEQSGYDAWFRTLSYNNDVSYRFFTSKEVSNSVRCLRD
jgi:uncharacterized protein (TIGR02145 family)